MLHNNNYLPGIPSFICDTPLTMPLTEIQINGSGIEESQSHDNNIHGDRVASNYINITNPVSQNSTASGISFENLENQNLQINSNASLLNPDHMSDMCEHQGPPTGTQNCGNLAWNNVTNPRLLCQPIAGSSSPMISNAGYSFTFTTPTQSCLYSPALTATTQDRLYSSRATPQTFAPSGFTHWQHTVPHRLCWTGQGNVQQGVPVFTGCIGNQPHYMCSVSQPSVCSIQSSPVEQPIASCSRVPRRPKRHSTENLEYLSPTNKVHLSEDKIANHLQELTIQCASPSKSSSILPVSQSRIIHQSTNESTFQTTVGHHSITCQQNSQRLIPQEKCWRSILQEQWHSFKVLEEDLSISDDGEEEDCKQLNFNIVDGMTHMIKPPDVIPKEILKEIQRPCMEIVPWAPPGISVMKTMSSKKLPVTDKADLDSLQTEYDPRSPGITDGGIEDDEFMDIDSVDDSLML